jgi:hypothetical protein
MGASILYFFWNLIGIKRRMIDIGKKITFFNMGIKTTQNFMLISNSLMPAFRNVPNKSLEQKTMKKCTKTKILKMRIVFWL